MGGLGVLQSPLSFKTHLFKIHQVSRLRRWQARISNDIGKTLNRAIWVRLHEQKDK
jgi:hypothetical protein